MVDPSLLEYLRANRGSHTLEQLRQGLLQQGADPAEVEAAIREIFGPPRRKSFVVKAALALGALLLLAAVAAWLVRLSVVRSSGRLGVGPPLEGPPTASAAEPEIMQALADYRTHYLDPSAHMRLARILFLRGFRSDAFHVLGTARDLFSNEQFLAAHREMIQEVLRNKKLQQEMSQPVPENMSKNFLYLLAGYFAGPTDTRLKGMRESIISTLRKSREVALAVDKVKTADKLLPYFDSDDASLRAQACLAAAALDDSRLIDPLVKRLDDNMENVRQSAGHALLEMSKTHRAQVLALWEPLEASPSPFVRAEGLDIFAKLDSARALPAMIKALDDPAPYMRFSAHRALVPDYKSDPRIKAAILKYYYVEKDPEVLAVLAAPVAIAVHNGDMALDKKNYPRAIEEYGKALQFKLEPDIAGNAYFGLGEAHLELGHAVEAEATYRRAWQLMKVDPYNFTKLCDLASALSMQGKVKPAAESLRQCLIGSKKAGKLRVVLHNCERERRLASLRSSPLYKKVLKEFR